MKMILALGTLCALAAAIVAPPPLTIAGLLLAGAVFGARALAAWPHVRGLNLERPAGR